MHGMYDVVIAGGGPAGLSAALVLGRCCRTVLLCDTGTPRNASSLAVHNFLTREGMSPDDLRAAGRREVQALGVDLRDAEVTAARRLAHQDLAFEVTLGRHETVQARRLLLATGIRDETPKLPGLQERLGRGVFYCMYCDAHAVRGRPLAVLGHGAKGADMALALTTWSEQVTLLTHGGPRPSVRACRTLREDGVDVIGARIVRLEGSDRLEALVLRDGRKVPCEGLFLALGDHPQSRLAQHLGCAVTRHGAIKVGPGQRTSVQGVYAAGDAADQPHAVVVAAGSGATAAFAINRDLRMERRHLPPE